MSATSAAPSSAFGLDALIRGATGPYARRSYQGIARAVLTHISAHCRGVSEALRAATLEAPVLASGPIAPGIRRRYAQGAFLVGNIAGEAHPIVAERISMAMQSGWLLARLLLGCGDAARHGRDVREAKRLQSSTRRSPRDKTPLSESLENYYLHLRT